jgi:hypothetical protein
VDLEASLEQPKIAGISVALAVIHLYRRDNDEDEIGKRDDYEKGNSDGDETENEGYGGIDRHRNLEIERLLPVRVDGGILLLFDQPEDQWTHDMAEGHSDKATKGGQVA